MKQFFAVNLFFMVSVLMANQAYCTDSFIMKIIDGKPMPYTGAEYRVVGQATNILPNGIILGVSGKYFISNDPPAFAAGVTPITITADDVELDLNGFTITGPGAGAGTDAGITATGVTNVVIKNGAIERIAGNGIELNFCNSITVKDILCRANTVDGVQLTDCTSIRIENVLCSSNTSNGFNIATVGNEHCSLVDCRAEGNGSNGFLDAGGASISYKNCTAYNNTEAGMDLTANNHQLQNCSSSENTTIGLAITGTSVDVMDCHFDDNTTNGLFLDDVTDFCIDRCSMNRNTLRGVLITDSVNGSLLHSCITGNGTQGIGVLGTSPSATSAISICENIVTGNGERGIVLELSTTQSCQVISNKVVSNTGRGIDIGGGDFDANDSGGAAATSHELFSNFAKNNGTTPAGSPIDTNYSNNVQASPDAAGASPNGLVVTPAAFSTSIQNITT